MDDLVKRLREVSLEKQQEAWGRLDGGQDLSIGAMLADEAAEAIIALRARADLPPKVKALVWEVHPVGLVAGSSYGSSYMIDTRRKRANIIKGLTFSQEFETVEQAKGAAQADFEARILSALDWPLTASNKTRTS